MTGKAPRILCPVCNGDVALRQDGTLYRHRYYGSFRPKTERPVPVGEVCPGSGTENKMIMDSGFNVGLMVSQDDQGRKEEMNTTNGNTSFNLVGHLHRQREWSAQAFGPATGGPVNMDSLLDHILKELKELILCQGEDVKEWIDLAILAFDGAWRLAGVEPEEIAAALLSKQLENEQRKWPDWRTATPGKAIEHIRDGEDYDHDLVQEGLATP